MNLVTLERVRKQFSERLLLDDVDLRVNAGDRIGLIGVNGSGKSTLLRLVAGLEAPDAGTVTVWGGVRVTYLPQEPELEDAGTVLEAVYAGGAPQLALLADYHAASRRLAEAPGDPAAQERLTALAAALDRAGGWAAEAQARALLSRLGMSEVELPLGSLSGGLRKRVALAQALLDPAELLLLDEPTNHLDAETVAWLEAELLRGPRALLMVTHDRYFLDRVANRIVDLDRRQLLSYPGNYGRYLEQRAERHERLAKAEEDRRRQLRRELEWLRRAPQARSTKQKARVERVRELERLRYDRGADRISLALAGRRLGKEVLEARGLGKRYGERVVLEDVDLRLGPGDRLGLVGPNGAGKTTLLDLLAGRLAPDAGLVKRGETVAIGYFDQRNAALREEMKVIDFVDREAPVIRMADGSRVSSARMLEWLLFPGPQQHARIGSLSGGERRRLTLLLTLMHQPNVLLLDEPTNDFDIQTLQVLESFLDSFEGCLVVASHDRYFLDRTVDQLAVLDGGRLASGYPLPFDTFLRLRAAGREAAGPRPPAAPPRPRRRQDQAGEAPAAAPGRKHSWKEARELEALEARIAALEARQAELGAVLAAGGSDYGRLQDAADALQALGEELDGALERWLALGEGAG